MLVPIIHKPIKSTTMSELTKRQAGLIRRQINKLYGRNYIPLLTTDSTLTIGDILESKHDIMQLVDSSSFSKSSTMITEGEKVNKQITSDSSVNITFKAKGQAVLSEYLKLDEAGIGVEFTSNNQMYLRVIGMRQQSLKNFLDFRNELLNKFLSGEITSKVFVVRGLVYADKLFMQFSGTKGGTVGFSVDAKVESIKTAIDTDFSCKWTKDVGYNVDAPNGGVLAYRVSGVRLRREFLPENIQKKILKGVSEATALSTLTVTEKQELINMHALDVVDLTDEVLLERNEDIS
jgi:hypothetical protein